ncbi:MAG: transglutaminase-like domain-containing protein [Eubacteriales bacterium]|nr:transglutaminase-like domain-containing protein [Eubacteriales bacterium]
MSFPLYSPTPIDDLEHESLLHRTLVACLRISMAVLFCFFLSQIVLPMFFLPTRPFLDAISSLLAILFLRLVAWKRRSYLVGAGLLTLSALVLLFNPAHLRDRIVLAFEKLDQLAFDMAKLRSSEVGSKTLEASTGRSVLYFLIFAFIVLLAYLCIARFRLPIPAAIALLVLILLIFKSSKAVSLVWVSLAFIIILLSALWDSRFFYDRGNRRGQIAFSHKKAWLNLLQISLPVITALIFALILLPLTAHKTLFSPFLRGIVDDLSNALPASFDINLKLSNFNLNSCGYPAQLTKEIPNQVNPSDEEILELKGLKSGLLAATRYDSFDGRRWDMRLQSAYFRFGSPFHDAKKESDRVFPKLSPLEIQKPDTLFKSELISYQLRPLREQLQSLFADGIVRSFNLPREGDRLIYYNRSANLYVDEPFSVGIPYRVESRRLPSPFSHRRSAGSDDVDPRDAERLNALKSDLAGVVDNSPNREDAYKHFLELPNLEVYSANGRIQQTALEITADLEHPLDKINAIRNYLSSSKFHYTLNPPQVPDGRELVSFFLEDGNGYCVYFATAMTMMLREVGIPARYVEGFSIPEHANRDELIAIREKQGHAWTEAYVDGLGWIEVEASPSPSSESDNEPTPSSNTEPSTSATPPPTTSTTTTQASTSPPVQTTPAKTPPPPSFSLLRPLLIFLLILFLIALAAALRFYYAKRQLRIAHTPAALSELEADVDLRLRYLWQEIRQVFYLIPATEAERVVAASHSPSPSKSTSIEDEAQYFLQVLNDQLSVQARDAIAASYTSVEASYFSPHMRDESELHALEASFDELEALLKSKMSRLAYLFQRLLPFKSPKRRLLKLRQSAWSDTNK